MIKGVSRLWTYFVTPTPILKIHKEVIRGRVYNADISRDTVKSV
jgi:hypothetical protein